MSSVFLLIRLAVATGLVLAPGAIVARAVGVRSTSATLAWGLGIVFARDDRRLRGARLADARARAASRRRARRGAVRASAGRWCPQIPGRELGLGRRGRARPAALARRRRDRRRRSLPPRARPQARRVRRPAPVVRERVRRRRAPPGLRLPALAGVPRADREGRLRRSVEGRAPRGDRARAARRAGGLRGGLRAVPAGRARRRVGRRGGRDRGDGRRARRLVHLARAAGDVVAPAPRPGRARARVRGAARPDEGAARERRRRVARARRRPPDLRDLPLDPVRRLPRRALGVAVREVRQRLPHPRRARRARPGCSSPGSCRSCARRPRSAPTRTSAPAASSTTPASSTARPTSSGSHRRCSAARARSPSPRCC